MFSSLSLQLLGPFFQLAMWLVSSGLLCVLSPIFQTHPQLVLATQGLVAVQLIHQLLVSYGKGEGGMETILGYHSYAIKILTDETCSANILKSFITK